jgi:hypothetical protein
MATEAVNRAVYMDNLPSLHQLLLKLYTPATPSAAPLFRYPVLINLPDSKGWSPIHHCVSAANPSISVLDALYLAGADVSLFTADEHFSPLHVLASSPHEPSDPDIRGDTSSLSFFATHLIKDLRSPLSATNKEDETCIHIAAEKGTNLDLLVAFLDCDSAGKVRELRNSRGSVRSYFAFY